MTVFTIKIYFDPICAWSYIGHRTLDQSISLFQKTYPGASSDEFRFSWLPYYRDKTLPSKGVVLEQRLIDANGPEQASILQSRVKKAGLEHGIVFNFEGKIGNTKDAHRLVHFAGLSGEQEAQRGVVEKLYRWFEDGEDITSFRFLQRSAIAAGMAENDVVEVLETGRYGEEVDALEARARTEGISALPTFDINGIKVEGAESVSNLYSTFVDIKEGERESE